MSEVLGDVMSVELRPFHSHPPRTPFAFKADRRVVSRHDISINNVLQ